MRAAPVAEIDDTMVLSIIHYVSISNLERHQFHLSGSQKYRIDNRYHDTLQMAMKRHVKRS